MNSRQNLLMTKTWKKTTKAREGLKDNHVDQMGNTSSDEDFEFLEKEIRELRHQASCKICMENEVGVVFLPCSHLIACPTCATSFENCPLCRRPIQQLLRTFLS